jgi:hypothetical protein
MGSGKITTEFTVWCGKCEVWWQESMSRNKTEFAEYIQKYGWRKTKEYGWVCPDCRKDGE